VRPDLIRGEIRRRNVLLSYRPGAEQHTDEAGQDAAGKHPCRRIECGHVPSRSLFSTPSAVRCENRLREALQARRCNCRLAVLAAHHESLVAPIIFRKRLSADLTLQRTIQAVF